MKLKCLLCINNVLIDYEVHKARCPMCGTDYLIQFNLLENSDEYEWIPHLEFDEQ